MATRSRGPSSMTAGLASATVDKANERTTSAPNLPELEVSEATAEVLAEVTLHGFSQSLRGREERIALRAHLIAADRGFAPGHALDDWLAAEREVDAELADENFTPEVG
jgi:hypothetical protein